MGRALEDGQNEGKNPGPFLSGFLPSLLLLMLPRQWAGQGTGPACMEPAEGRNKGLAGLGDCGWKEGHQGSRSCFRTTGAPSGGAQACSLLLGPQLHSLVPQLGLPSTGSRGLICTNSVVTIFERKTKQKKQKQLLLAHVCP